MLSFLDGVHRCLVCLQYQIMRCVIIVRGCLHVKKDDGITTNVALVLVLQVAYRLNDKLTTLQ